MSFAPLYVCFQIVFYVYMYICNIGGTNELGTGEYSDGLRECAKPPLFRVKYMRMYVSKGGYYGTLFGNTYI